MVRPSTPCHAQPCYARVRYGTPPVYPVLAWHPIQKGGGRKDGGEKMMGERRGKDDGRKSGGGWKGEDGWGYLMGWRDDFNGVDCVLCIRSSDNANPFHLHN